MVYVGSTKVDTKAAARTLGTSGKYRSNLQKRTGEEAEASKRLREELERIKAAADLHQTEASAAQEKATGLGKMVEALAETGVPTQESLYQFQRLYLLQRLLNSARISVQTYCEFIVHSGVNIDEAISLSRRLDEAAGKFKIIDDEIVKLALPMPGSFRKGVRTPSVYLTFPYREVEAIINEVVARAQDGIKHLASTHREYLQAKPMSDA